MLFSNNYCYQIYKIIIAIPVEKLIISDKRSPVGILLEWAYPSFDFWIPINMNKKHKLAI